MPGTIHLKATGEAVALLEDARGAGGSRCPMAVSLPAAGEGSGCSGSSVIARLRGEYVLADAPAPSQRWGLPVVATVGQLPGRVRGAPKAA